MRAVVLLLACFLITVLCQMEEKEDGSLSEITSNKMLVRNLREPERKQKEKKETNKRKSGKKEKNNAKRKNIKSSKKGRKAKSGKKGRKTKSGKKGRKTISGKKGQIVKKQRKGKGSPRATSTCNGTALGSTCLTNLISALKYERDAVSNFMNQKARAEGFNKLIGNKGGKNDSFGNSTTYLLTALGGNVSNLTCGSQNTSGAAAITTYKALTNCSTAVGAACTVPNNTVNFTQLDTCKTYYETVQTTNKNCFEMTNKKSANGTAVCECWKSAAEAVATAKQKSSSCNANTAQSDMKDLKNTCLAAYGVCKKAEDASVSYILKCSTDSSSSTNSTSTTASVTSNSTSTTASGGRAARHRLL